MGAIVRAGVSSAVYAVMSMVSQWGGVHHDHVLMAAAVVAKRDHLLACSLCHVPYLIYNSACFACTFCGWGGAGLLAVTLWPMVVRCNRNRGCQKISPSVWNLGSSYGNQNYARHIEPAKESKARVARKYQDVLGARGVVQGAHPLGCVTPEIGLTHSTLHRHNHGPYSVTASKQAPPHPQNMQAKQGPGEP